MKFEVNKLRSDEIEINIENIIKQCIKRIGIIIICAVVFALIVPGLVYVKDLNAYNSRTENQEQPELSDAELAGVSTYKVYKNKVDQLKNYGKNALVLKLDYENVYQGRLQFYVDAEEDVQFDIAYVIANYINAGNLAEKLYKQESLDATTYADEIFGAEVSGAKDGVPSGVVNFRVWASGKEECERYVSLVKKALTEYDKTLNSTMAEHTLEVVSEEVILGYVYEVEAKQNIYAENYAEAVENLEAHAATLTEVQLQAIQNADASQKDDAVVTPSFSIKFAIVGFVLGAILAVGCIVLYIIFGGKLQTEQELLKRFNISHFGNITCKNAEEKVGIVCARLAANLENSKRTEVALIGTAKELSSDAIVKLQNALKDCGIKCEIIGNILTDKAAFEAMKKKECVVLVETIGKSVIKEIYEESMVCIDSKVEVVGYISIME